MPAASIDSLLGAYNWRYACKKFDPARKLDDSTWEALQSAIHLAPSSFGVRTSRAYVVTDPAVRAKLRENAWGQSQLTDASHLLVFAYRTDLSVADGDALIDLMVATRGVPREALEQYRGMVNGALGNPAWLKGGSAEAFCRDQTYLALGFLLASAAALGVDACPMEGFNAQAFDEILGLPAENFRSTALCALGYRASDDWLAPLKKVRFPRETVIVER
jgi:nitroreductase